ncbi:MAG: FecR domain-containing protein [Steroidobacteraceae bacterium]
MNAEIQSEAADWVVEFQTGEVDAVARERFAGWLRSSPEHVRAYIELVTLWEDARLYDRGRAIAIDDLIAAARSEPNVVALASPESHAAGPDSGGRRPASRKHAWTGTSLKVAVAAAVVLLVIGGLLVMPRPAEYATGIGEQRTVSLSDGSSVELDAVSRIRVEFGAHERRVDLLEGQALFRVAKNAARPFVVVSGGTRVRDVGTQFDVNRNSFKTVVTVIEGLVSISYSSDSIAAPSPISVSLRPIEVGAGEQVVVAPHMIPRPEPANVMTATAWTRNELIFQSTALPEVAAEFNRLNARQLVIEGPQLQDFHVSGVFPALDPASLPRFVQFLRAQPGIKVTVADDRIIVTEK